MTEVRPPFEQTAVEAMWADPPFIEEGVRAMFMSVGLGQPTTPDAAYIVAARLNELARDFALDRWAELQPSLSEDELSARRLALACQSVLRSVGLEGGCDSPDKLLPFAKGGGLFAAAKVRGALSGELAVLGRIQAVDQLRLDAEWLASGLQRRRALHPPKRGNPEQRARKRLVEGLGRLFRATWEKEPTVVRGGDKPSGAFVRLMMHVAEAIRARLGSSAIAPTEDSLATAWERLRREEEQQAALLAQ